jgi:hypothetical protein
MNTHEYTLKVGLEFTSHRSLRTNKPLIVDTVLIDLLDGRQYRVMAIYSAKPADRECVLMPDTVMHAWPEGALCKDELDKLRGRANYVPDVYCLPLGDVVFFPPVR